MLVETWWSRRNEHRLRLRGAVAPAGDVYGTMSWAYPASVLAIGVEGTLRGVPPAGAIVAGLVVLTLSKALKLWAIHALGAYWSFRVLILPDHRLVASGPYRFVRHPNYVAVIGEMMGAALLLGAPIAGAIAVAGFCWLIRRRVLVEERALRR